MRIGLGAVAAALIGVLAWLALSGPPADEDGVVGGYLPPAAAKTGDVVVCEMGARIFCYLDWDPESSVYAMTVIDDVTGWVARHGSDRYRPLGCETTDIVDEYGDRFYREECRLEITGG